MSFAKAFHSGGSFSYQNQRQTGVKLVVSSTLN